MVQMIGLMGSRGSGKATAARVIEQEISGSCALFLDDPIRFAASILLGIDAAIIYREDTRDVIVPQWDTTPAAAEESLKAHLCETYGEDYCVKRLESALEEISGTSLAIVCGITKPCEVELVCKKHKGEIIGIERPGFSESKHFTELLHVWSDYIIENDGTIEEFEAEVSRVLKGL